MWAAFAAFSAANAETPWPDGLLDARPPTEEGIPRAVASKQVGVAPLDPIRLKALLETIAAAGVGPSFWVVVEDAALERDALLRFERTGDILKVTHTAWAPRVPANAEDPRGRYRESMNRPAPKKGSHQVVVQGYVRRERTAYRHRPLAAAERSGLLALLEKVDVLRATRRVPEREPPRTLAVAFQDAYLEPSACTRPGDVHHDRAQAFLILADANGVQLRAELEPGSTEPRRFPRAACEPGDGVALAAEPDRFAASLAKRPRLPIVEWTEDGAAVVRAADAAWRVTISPTGESALRIERLE